jgi:hypothetical protein
MTPNHSSEEPTVGEWEPISSAPRDGSWFIGFWQPFDTVSFEQAIVTVAHGPLPCRWTNSPANPDGGYFYVVGNMAFVYGYQPTHWMPLPPPPKEKPE